MQFKGLHLFNWFQSNHNFQKLSQSFQNNINLLYNIRNQNKVRKLYIINWIIILKTFKESLVLNILI